MLGHGSQTMSMLTGIDVDQFGNVLMATSTNENETSVARCNLEVFDVQGNHLRTLSWINIRPCGICLNNDKLFLADVVNRQIKIFSFSDESSTEQTNGYNS